MAREAEDRSTHIVYEKDRIGEVKIADEVVAIIAGLAATEVDGVDSMAGNITNELVGKLGMKNLSKGVKVTVTEDHVIVDLSLNMKYGYSIPAVNIPFSAGVLPPKTVCFSPFLTLSAWGLGSRSV